MTKRDSVPSRLTETWAVAPLVYFDLDWPGQHHDLGWSVCLLAADASVTQEMAKLLLGLLDPEAFLVADVSWLLATKYLVPGFATNVDTWQEERCGTHKLHEEIVQSFVVAWNLVKPRNVKVPHIFAARVEPQSHRITGVKETTDYAEFKVEAGCVCKAESLTLADVKLFQDVWAGIARLREFPEGVEGLPPRDLEFLFQSEQIERRTAATRLARALRFFEAGLWLDELHAFLSFWLAMECLIGTSTKEVKKQLCHRIACMLGDYGTYYPEVERLYGRRSDLVHGRSDRIDERDAAGTYWLCCKSLRKILTEADLFRAFTSHTEQDVRYLEGLGP